jgi:hypothetical protein
MNSDERQLITDLFGRMQRHGPVEKDTEAAALIGDRVRAMPDAPYMLVQSVLVQEMALQQADERVRELEARVAELERSARPAAAAGGGSFLGGLFGGGSAARPVARGAVPSGVGGRTSAPAASPWGHQAPQQAQPAAAGGGFMRSAMATAAGVAGGMLLADGIRSMMNGNSTPAAPTNTASAETPAAGDTAATDYQDPAANDPGYQDAGYDDGGADFGGDFDV